jgi:hypothetical protein
MHKIRLSALALAGWFAAIGTGSAAITFQEDFSTDPAGRGWSVLGDTDLFQWNPTNQDLQVTWDSSRPNSYFAHPLGTVLSEEADFSLGFNLRLSDFAAGVNPDKPYPFELSVGLINLAEATQTGFVRGTGSDSPDLVEFSFFPDPGGVWVWGPSVTVMFCDWTGTNWSSGGFGSLTLSPNDCFQVDLAYTAAERVLRTSMTCNGLPFGPPGDAYLGASFRDFRVDHVAVCSYSDAGQDPSFAGSLLAHGAVDNFRVSLAAPPPPNLAGRFTNGAWQVEFLSLTNRLYTLERTADFQSWTAVSPATAGNGANLALQDPGAPADWACYRVRVE